MVIQDTITKMAKNTKNPENYTPNLISIFALVFLPVLFIKILVLFFYNQYIFALINILQFVIFCIIYKKMKNIVVSKEKMEAFVKICFIFFLPMYAGATCFYGWYSNYHIYILTIAMFIACTNITNKKVLVTFDGITITTYLITFIASVCMGKISKDTSLIAILGVINLLSASLTLMLMILMQRDYMERVVKDFDDDKKTLDKESKVDHLTGVFNRRSMEKYLDTLIDQYKITGKTFGMILLDIDHFKAVNDTYGHLSGDKVLVEMSRLVSYSLRKSDSVFRYGGEEFLVVLSGVQSKKELFEVAEEIRKDVEALNIPLEQLDLSITVSCGTTIYDGKDITSNIKRVDDALYTAKETGRNKTEFL